jgi:prepilin-type processing-associated H-X9-DG protein
MASIDRPADAIMILENKNRLSDATYAIVGTPLSHPNYVPQNRSGVAASVPPTEGALQHHNKMVNFIFADGHAKAMRLDRTIFPNGDTSGTTPSLWNCDDHSDLTLRCTLARRQSVVQTMSRPCRRTTNDSGCPLLG